MRRVKLNDKPYFVADRWSELQLKHLIGLEEVDTEDEVAVFSVLSGLNVEVVENSQAITEEIYKVVAFIYEATPEWKKLQPPTHLVIGGKPYKLPKIDKCVLGQNIMLDNLIERPLVESIPTVLAIYFQPLIDGGKFNRERLPAVEKMILEANALECYATAGFFLRGGKNLLRIMRVGYIRARPTPWAP